MHENRRGGIQGRCDTQDFEKETLEIARKEHNKTTKGERKKRGAPMRLTRPLNSKNLGRRRGGCRTAGGIGKLVAK